MVGADIGRFGWKGQTRSLGEFVASACAIELGLQVENIPQQIDPTRPDYRLDGVDLENQQVELLTRFVSQLPTPEQRFDRGVDQRSAARGENHFELVKCSVCHRPEVGEVTGIYSDLLIHRMGEGLADPVSAVTEKQDDELTSPYFSSSFGLHANTPELQQSWRTPPLWGVADSAPYMHDGRASTLLDAIRLHGGEAAESAALFESLEEQQQRDLIAFLNSLRAPEESDNN